VNERWGKTLEKKDAILLASRSFFSYLASFFRNADISFSDLPSSDKEINLTNKKVL
jgi:hypothetical protein